jgi:hypothetical protein
VGRASKRRRTLTVARALTPACASIAFFAAAAPALALELPAGIPQAPATPTQPPSASSAAPAPGGGGGVAGVVSASNTPGTLAEPSRRASVPTTSPGSGAPPSRAPAPQRTIRTLLETTVYAVEADVSGAPARSREDSSSAVPPASSAKSTRPTGLPARPSATPQEASSVVGVAGSLAHSAALRSAGRATVDRGNARSARAGSELPSGATDTAAGHGAPSAASASRLASGTRFAFRGPSRHGLAASVPSHSSLLTDIAPASSSTLLALLLVLAAAIGGTVVVLSGLGRRPRMHDWRRRVAAVRRAR